MIHYWGNVIEAVFWMMIAATVYLRSDHSSASGWLRVGTRAAVAFFWFGISDLIEVQTGAWYRPLGLLAMKGVCVAVLLHCFACHRRSQRLARISPARD
jgi:hypothetical protein